MYCWRSRSILINGDKCLSAAIHFGKCELAEATPQQAVVSTHLIRTFRLMAQLTRILEILLRQYSRRRRTISLLAMLARGCLSSQERTRFQVGIRSRLWHRTKPRSQLRLVQQFATAPYLTSRTRRLASRRQGLRRRSLGGSITASKTRRRFRSRIW